LSELWISLRPSSEWELSAEKVARKVARKWLEAAWCCWLGAAGWGLPLGAANLDGRRRYPLAANSWLNQSGDKSPHSKFGRPKIRVRLPIDASWEVCGRIFK
jgi:hypothetical protein